MNIIGKRKIFFLISFLIIIPGLISLFLFGLNLSIDFTGGSRFSVSLSREATRDDAGKLKSIILKDEISVSSVETAGNILIARTEAIPQNKNQQLRNEISESFENSKIEQFETIGPTIGSETTINAVKAVALSSLLIVIYITYVFRKVPKPASSLSFGVSTIIALLHDILVVLGGFSILGHFLNVEIDSLFVTAVLTVIGFSVHDTIVVFDRIRENLIKGRGDRSFEEIVNDSILQTFTRSINTSLTVLLVLFALLLFGGETIRWFVVALFIGIASGTYSSIFNAAPILVVWTKYKKKI